MTTKFLAIAAVTITCAVGAHAQPDPNNAPKAENPQNRAPRAAQRQEQMRTMMAERTKAEFTRLGVTELAHQEALTNFIVSETVARQALTVKARNLNQALRNDALTNNQVAAVLNEYLASIEEDKTRREAAILKLKQTFDYTKLPKVEAYLTLAGLVGDGPIVGGNMGGLINRRMNELAVQPAQNNRQNRNEANTLRGNRANAPAGFGEPVRRTPPAGFGEPTATF